VQTAWNITGRIHVNFAPEKMRKTDKKTCLLILQSIQVAVPQGAKVMITIEEGRTIIRGIGPKVTFDEALWSALTHTHITPDTPPKHVQFALLQALDLALQLQHSSTEMTDSF
jgi:hypothetical protein